MGPAAWAAIGRALGIALAGAVFGGPNSLPAVAAKEIQRSLANRDFDIAQAMLRDLAFRHRQAFERFMQEYGADLPPEVLDELRRTASQRA